MDNRQTGPNKFDSYTYNDGNELLTSTEHPHQNTQNEYDVNGNLIKKTETISKWKVITSYTYDDENRLTGVEITKNDGSGMRRTYGFAYDPFGRRISKTIEKEEFTDDDNDMRHGHDNDGHLGMDKDHHHDRHGHNDYPKTTFYIYDNQNIIAEYDQNNTQTASYIYGPNIDEPLSADINNTRIYYHADGLGSITTLTNHMGHKVQQYDYDSFGNIKSTPFWIKQPYTYTAREFDYDTNLYYYRARYYDPQAGRFITRDPIGFEGGDYNLYLYARNNPANNVDPLGLYVKLCQRDLDLIGLATQKIDERLFHNFISINGITFGFTTHDEKFRLPCIVQGPGAIDVFNVNDIMAQYWGYKHGSCRTIQCDNEDNLREHIWQQFPNAPYYYCLRPNNKGIGINCQQWANMMIDEYCCNQ